ncbi:TetR/AcrR family transcriptional regulator [Mycobacterium paragordonae]|uniref:TetR/AcrR family transcriptional regulator n=1 Tax=Mycobacterium paragordonae TaxID=1389713 RepID=UPI0014095B4C|nr:TetR/AcrR family transcriptional regulator [Mycobacterium paragordonae]
MAGAYRDRDPARRAELIAAAAACFADRPFDEVSMEDIAAKAGVAKGLLFYYFKSKRGCYLAVIDEFHRQMLAVAESSAETPQAEVVEEMLDRYLDFAESAEPAYRLIMSGGLGNDPTVRDFIAVQRAKYRAVFSDLALPGQSEHPLLRVTFEGFLSFMEGATLDWLGHRQITRSALKELILAVAAAVLDAAASIEPALPIRRDLSQVDA